MKARWIRLIRAQPVYCGSIYLGTLWPGAVGKVVRDHGGNIIEVSFINPDETNGPTVCINAMDTFDTQEQST